jgi:hypothetical protein
MTAGVVSGYEGNYQKINLHFFKRLHGMKVHLQTDLK